MFDIAAILLFGAVGFWSATALAQPKDADLEFEMQISAPYAPTEVTDPDIVSSESAAEESTIGDETSAIYATEDDLAEIIEMMDDEAE
jgi:hypothetical protein